MGENIIAHDIDSTRTKDVLIGENVSFQTMFLSPKTLEGLTKSGFQKPSPIQLRAIPLGRCGFDLIVKSKSGTGKTIVFSIVALEMIDVSSLDLQVLILAPTREIAVQIADTIKAVGISFSGLKVNSFIGGLPEKDDIEKARNCQIAVGAPGRLKSLIKQNVLNVTHVKLLVLDEADKLMEESFKEDVNEIYQKLPIKKQVITASATYADNLKEFLSRYMQSPTYVSAENDTQLLLGLKHFIREVKPSQNSAQEMKFKNEELLKLLSRISFTQCIIFSNYQTRAENISISINRHGWNSMFISAAQTQEKRLEAINKLKNFKCRILLSTDLTARGIDASNIDLVINYDVPIDVSTYLHRMGRAGRYGSKGVCITLISGQKDLIQIRRFLGNIGGTQLTIAKLNDIENGVNDLWASDDSKLEKISGIIEENEDVTCTIKNEILSLKKCSSDEGTETEKTNDHEDIKNYLNKNTIEKDSELSGNNRKGNASRKKPKNKKSAMKVEENDNTDVNISTSKMQTELIAVDGDMNAYLQSLANGTFDFASMSVPESNDSVEDDVYTNTCLQSLANGTFDFNRIPSPKKIPGNIDEFPIKNDTIVQALTEIENQFLKSKIEESETLSNNSTSHYKEKSQENDISGCKKKNEKTRTSSVLEAENEGKACKNEVYIKNKGIYEVARILNSQAKPDSETELNLSNYLNILENSTNVNQVKPNNECVAEQNTKAEGSDQVTLNIFSHAYQHAVEIVDTHWKLILKDNETQFHHNRSEINDNDHMEEDSEDDDVGDEYMDHEVVSDDEMLNEDSEMEYDEHGYINIPNRMVWVPVEENTLKKVEQSPPINLLEDDTSSENIAHEPIVNPSQVAARCSTNELLHQENSENPITLRYNEHFTECFRTYSDALWNQGLKFSSTEEFDKWYDGWLQQVSNVREYVRQNIYVKEMSQYQNGKRNY